MTTRTLVLFGALLIIASVGVVSLGDGSSDEAVSSPLAGFRESTARAAARSDSPEPPGAGPVRVAGVMINSPVHTGEDPASEDTFGVDLAFFGTFSKTRLALEFALPDGGILGIDDDASSITSFRDNQGTDLRNSETMFGPFEMSPRVSEDTKHMVFVAASDKVPARGSTHLTLAGTLAVRTATTSETFTTEELALASGTKFSSGGFDFEIVEVGPSTWGDEQMITLSTDRDTIAIVSWAVVDADGAVTELSQSMSMSGMGSWQFGLDAATLPERGAFRLEVWQDLATTAVPFQVETGVGL